MAQDLNGKLNGAVNLGWGIPGLYKGTTDGDGDFDGALDADSRGVGGKGN